MQTPTEILEEIDLQLRLENFTPEQYLAWLIILSQELDTMIESYRNNIQNAG